ncbi:MAG: response regulator transcription factor [Spirochaetales bacterium]|nr:response regulator transcription factor [Spirochaetales bacterium]
MATVLVVDDEHDLNRMICDYLASKGHDTRAAYDGAEAIRTVFDTHPDIIILDLNLPNLDGLEVARVVATQTAIPTIITTARGEEDDRLAGLTAGADDYVVKPFSLPELALRIEAVLRRTRRGPADTSQDTVVSVGDVHIDIDRRIVTVAGRRVDLTAAQFAILLTLAKSPGRVFTRLQLLDSVQDTTYDGYERTVDVHIKNIRKRIETDPHAPRRIVTVWGIGYRMEESG